MAHEFVVAIRSAKHCYDYTHSRLKVSSRNLRLTRFAFIARPSSNALSVCQHNHYKTVLYPVIRGFLFSSFLYISLPLSLYCYTRSHHLFHSYSFHIFIWAVQ